METTIENRVKSCIIERLNLSVKPEDIDNNEPIFIGSEGTASEKSLGLDSIDALELIVALSNEFDVKITDDDMKIFESIATITDFIKKKTQEKV